MTASPPHFEQVIAVASACDGQEYGQLPRCIVAVDVSNGVAQEEWIERGTSSILMSGISSEALVVPFGTPAELVSDGIFRTRSFSNVVDCGVETRNKTNGVMDAKSVTLKSACAHYNVEVGGTRQPDHIRELLRSGGPYIKSDQSALLCYVAGRAHALARLFRAMSSSIDWGPALIRGRYGQAAAAMEATGIPLDVSALRSLLENWERIRTELIEDVNREFGVYEGSRFVEARFEAYVLRRGWRWPRHTSGRLMLDEATLRSQSGHHPELEPLRQLRGDLCQLRRPSLEVGEDSRARAPLSTFGARTSRNTPGGQMIFTLSRWMRGLIVPPAGTSLVYSDWKQQDFGIAAALSGDEAMLSAYRSGTPYLAYAKQAGAAPEHATTATHGTVRNLYKTASLAVLYGMGARSLASKLGVMEVEAKELLASHRRIYHQYWEWSEDCIDRARLEREIVSTFGWRMHVSSDTKDTALRNWPVQANGAEMMRIAAILAHEAGIKICAPVHDAFLIEATDEEVGAATSIMVDAMAQASEIVLGGFRLQTEVETFQHPERWPASAHSPMWKLVSSMLEVTP